MFIVFIVCLSFLSFSNSSRTASEILSLKKKPMIIPSQPVMIKREFSKESSGNKLSKIIIVVNRMTRVIVIRFWFFFMCVSTLFALNCEIIYLLLW